MITVVFDFETGGVEPHHPNISLAAIAVKDGVEIDSMNRLIQFDETTAQPEALAINHYDRERWEAEAKPEEEVARTFAAFLYKHRDLDLFSARTGKPYRVARLAGYNSASFDGPRLQACFDKYGIFPGFWRPTLDVLQLALNHVDVHGVSLRNHKLSTVAEHFGIATDGAHDALADCRMTALIHAKIKEMKC